MGYLKDKINQFINKNKSKLTDRMNKREEEKEIKKTFFSKLKNNFCVKKDEFLSVFIEVTEDIIERINKDKTVKFLVIYLAFLNVFIMYCLITH